MRFRDFVPDDKEYWYYHEPSGVVLYNTGEYGWMAISRFDTIQTRADELEEVLSSIKETGDMVEAADVATRIIDYMQECEDNI